MSESRRKYVGYPNAKSRPQTYFLYPPGRGGGGDFCYPTMGKTSHAEKIDVSKFLVFNRYLVLLNEFNGAIGVGFYRNAGAAFTCSNSRGAPMDWWIALSHQGELTDEEIVQRGVKITTPAFDTAYLVEQLIEFPVDKIPQPVLANGGVDPRWQGEIWYQMYWGDANAMAYAYTTESTSPSPPPSAFSPYMRLKVEKHDFDVKV